jgi:hypothetical protein
VHLKNRRQNFAGGQADSHPTTRRTITTTVASKARDLKVERLSATAGSRVVGRNIADVLAVLDKAKEFEELDRDRNAEI